MQSPRRDDPTSNPKATFIGSRGDDGRAYGENHPLAIPRVSLTQSLIHAYGALSEAEFVPARKAADYELEWFHSPDYVAAMKRSEALGRVKSIHRVRYRLGTLENPYFERFFTIAATATGASIQAAEAVLAGRIAFNPAGGMHHARPDHARGFCYFNDPVLAILRLRREGLRVLYVDLDAHHGDGVEEAFADDPEVLTLSLHMDTAYAYPHRGGRLEDAGTPAGAHTTVNVPLPLETHDAEYRLLFDAVWDPVLERFAPDAIVLQAGTDILAADPLGKLKVSTQCFLEVCAQVLRTAPRHADGTPRLLVTGGGGYHPLLLARAWTGLWGLLSGRALPEAIPPEGAELLRAVGWDQDEDAPHDPRLFESRLDSPEVRPVRPEVADLARRIRRHPFLA
ncbi:acetoin utilization protein AcuC [Pelomicrobium methylotrophicum]|uniref:acetoin utilization protein AcuC n=1 Tax=Pelomicrobium methylotrophicum TaxID=2602750 RepID=UPI00196A0FF1